MQKRKPGRRGLEVSNCLLVRHTTDEFRPDREVCLMPGLHTRESLGVSRA